jgi:hypothetical protein
MVDKLGRKVISSKKAAEYYREIYGERCNFSDEALRQKIKNLAKEYVGILSYKTTRGLWFFYEEPLIHALKYGCPEMEFRGTVYSTLTALRYLHANGIDRRYTRREMLTDLKARGYYKQGKRISRSHLNKFIREWNNG